LSDVGTLSRLVEEAAPRGGQQAWDDCVMILATTALQHMGSRAVAPIGRDLEAARRAGEALGAVWTRTGRPFFTP
jgi:protein phosphatase